MTGSDNASTKWSFSQAKGTCEEVTEVDIISTVEFNHDGELLATGDKGGRIVIFKKDPAPKDSSRHGEYSVYSTFQSHEPEFDCLKSLDIEEKINQITWLKQRNPAHLLLSINDKTIKLWKISEKNHQIDGPFNTKDAEGENDLPPSEVTQLRVPKWHPTPLMVEASPRKTYAHAHAYHINSVSANSDDETYLSADDLRINVWSLNRTDASFNIVDIKPVDMEDLTEVITAAQYHPQHCNTFAYSSSKGSVRLCDMRSNALCDRYAKMFEEPEDPANRSFFSELVSSMTDVKFSHCGRYMLTRDYFTTKVWDLQMEKKPVESYQVHEYLRSKLCLLYENDCIFDKFGCCWSGNDKSILTGSYNNLFRIFDRGGKQELCFEATVENMSPWVPLKQKKVTTTSARTKDEVDLELLDFNQKIMHTAWHPTENIIALAARSNLFLFQEKS